MSQRKQLKLLVSPFALVTIGGALAAGCGEDGGGLLGGDCSTIGARIDALSVGAGKLIDLSEQIKVDVAGACATLADMDPPDAPTDEQIQELCDAAVLRMNTGFEASATLDIIVVPPVCTVNAQAQIECEASCYAEADVTCDPGTIEARCDPGELSVQCEGTCQANATCEGSLDVAVACEGRCEGRCEGTCSGSCTGTCMGTCNGTCDGMCDGSTSEGGECNGTCEGTCSGSCDAECQGSCDATCEGECRGSCVIEAEGGIECSGGASCKGGCDGEFRAPSCEATLEPPSCEGTVEAECNADCEGSASFDAECSPAAIEIVGDLEADLQTDIEAALPTILVAVERGGAGALAAVEYSADAVVVGAQGLNCIAQVGLDVANSFQAQMEATFQAAASIDVSVRASVDVSASASAAGSAG